MPVSEQLAKILVCPKCHKKLKVAAGGEALDCLPCKLRYPVRDGVPVMLIDDAEPLSS
ncbi:MAG: hypothetical protein ACI8TX_001316 [Hyphomicrobiaceae bacterium]|jgi:uncharacterized protein YbaR (Trm112 family)